MKRFFSLLTCLLLLSSLNFAQAESINIDGLSNDDLEVLISRCQSKLSASVEDIGETWYDENNVKVICTNWGYSDSYGTPTLKFDFTVINDSGKSIYAGIRKDYMNGWGLDTLGNFCNNGVAPHKKLKSTETISLSNCDVTGYDDLAIYEFEFWVDLDSDNWNDKSIDFEKTIVNFQRYSQ